MGGQGPHACDAWQLLVQFFFTQRANLPSLAAELRLSPAQCHLLRLLEPGRAIAMGQLASSLSCDASNVTGLVDRLETRGLLKRHALAADRRVKVLELTPMGAKVRALLLQRMTTPPPTLDRLTVKEQRMLIRILSRLLESAPSLSNDPVEFHQR